jgi:hypothetical protein
MEKPTPPTKITVVYRPVGEAHVFTSSHIEGMHVARHDLRAAYDLLLSVVSGLIKRRFGGNKLHYDFRGGFEAFSREIKNRNPLIPTALVLSRRLRKPPPAMPRRAREKQAA